MQEHRRLRADGQVPAVVYGAGLEPVRIQVGHRDAELLLQKTADSNPIFQLALGDTGKKRHAIVREVHSDPITGQFLHIDFQRVKMDEVIRTTVHLELEGSAPGVKLGGMIDFVRRQLEVVALPADIPGHISVDISGLDIGDHLEVKDLEVPEGVEIQEDREVVIVSIQAPRTVEVEEEGEEDEVAEPEVIGKPQEE